MEKQKKVISSKKKAKRLLATAMAFAMTGSVISTGIMPVKEKVLAAAAGITEDFESESLAGNNMGNPNCAISDEAHNGSGALYVSERTQDWYAYSYDISKLAGKCIKLDAFMKVNSDNLLAAACVKSTVDGKDSYDWAACTSTKAGEWVELKSDYKLPEGANTLYFITHDSEAGAGTTDDYYLDDVSIKETNFLKEDFNYTDISEKQGFTFGSPTLALKEVGEDNKALEVSNREANYYGYAYDMSEFEGNTIMLTAKMATYEAEDDAENTVSATIKTTKSGEDDNYQCVASTTAVGKDFVTLTGTYEIPSGCDTSQIYFEAPENVSYLLDDVSITIEGDYAGGDEKPSYVDISSYEILKDLYKDYFKVGVASEALSHWGGSNPLNEIGNPAKEALIKQEFNSLTFGNELKPDYNMGYSSEEATETNLPFVIDTSAKEMLDWAKENGIPVRGHVLVWHSQCPDAIFCKDYKPVYTDESKKTLDSACYVNREIMLQRLESYIDNTMKYMYENGYGDTIYAWDVVNEAVEPGTNQYNLRNSYWYQTIGEDFIYYSFKYTREAVNKYAEQYAKAYGIDASDDKALEAIKPKLFYNDYNEYQASKRDAIISILTDKINGHSIKEEGLIDGVGMQSHVTDTTNIDTFVEALRAYDKAIGEVHITELDVAQTATGVNADYYQAAFFNNLFKALIDEVKNGVDLTSVTIWGLTDDNSWKKESSPLLFRSDLSKKMAFDGIVYAVTGQEMPEPAYVAPDFTDMNMDFETEGDVEGFGPRGDGKVTVQSDVVYKGSSALLDSGRTASWNGASFDVSRFLGQTIAVSAWVKSDASSVGLSADIDGVWPNIAHADTSSGEWVQIMGTYKLPSDMTSLKLYFEANDTSDIYIDHVKVKLVGLDEGFEEASHIASPRGVGHMPVVAVTDTQSHTGGHSYSVKRSAQDANMSFDVSKYIGQNVAVKAYVKTTDQKIKLGLDGDTPLLISEVGAVANGWTEVSGVLTIPNKLTSAKMYIETDGTADFYVDDISVRIEDYVDDVEGETLNFTTRWGGAGDIARVEDGEGNHAAVLTNRDETYYGIVFDVSAFLGMEVEISLDVKTNDSSISVTGDINDVWPNYITTSSDPGKYKTVRTIVNLPKDMTSLRVYVETNGKSDLYVDNLKIRRVKIDEEEVVPEPSKTPAPTIEPAPSETPSPSITPAPSVTPSQKPVYTVTLDMSKGDSVLAKAAELTKHLAKGEDVVFKVIGKDGKELCTWTFSASKYSKTSTLKDVKLEVIVKPGKSVGYSKGMFVNMKHQGKLPMEAKVKVKAESKFKPGTTLYLYRVDTKTKRLYCMPNSNYKVDKNGYVTLDVISGANYVLLPTIASNSSKTGVTSQVKTVKNVTVKKGSTKSIAAVLPDTLVKMSSFKNFNKKDHKAVYGAIVTYKTSKSSVATVSSNGKLTAKGKGKAVITTTVKLSNGKSRSYKTTVTVK